MSTRQAANDESRSTPADLKELVRKRDAFINSMTLLCNATEEASRAGLAYFDYVAGTTSVLPRIPTNGLAYNRGMSMPLMPIRAVTEEPEVKRKRKRKKRDPDMPRRPMTAYLLFCHKGREIVKKDLGDKATYKDVLAELTKRWKETPDEVKKRWQAVYQSNRSKYEHNIATYKAQKEASVAPASANATSNLTNGNHTEATANDKKSNKDSDTFEPATTESEDEQSEREEEEEAEESEEEVSPTKRKTPRGKETAATAAKNPKSTAASSPAAGKEKRERKLRHNRGEEKVEPEEEPKRRLQRRNIRKERVVLGNR